MISDSGTVDPENDETYSEAAEWFTRLQDGRISLEDTLEWQRLMTSNPQFAAAYAGIEEVWNAFGDVHNPVLAAPEHAKRDAYDGSVPVSEWLSRRRASPLNWRTSALLAASVAGIAVAAYWIFAGGPPADAILQTPAGQNKAFVLADGTRVNLGAGTRIEVRLKAKSREIELSRGEAFFAVAKDPNRPFTVHAGQTTATAVGTEFSVNRGVDQVLVAVIEGRVLVGSTITTPRNDKVSAAETKHLAAGEEILISTAAGARPHLGDVAMTIGWQVGRLAFQSEPLSRVLKDVNLYAPKPILLDNSSLGDLMITGTVVRTDINGWLASLEYSLPVRIIEDSQHITISAR